MTATTTTAPRRAALGAAGGVLWALAPAPWLIADIRTLDPGTATFAAVLATYAAVLVLGPALVVVGHTALPTGLAQRTATVGAVLAGAGLTAFAVGNGVELVSLAAGSGTSVAGYVVSYVGFLLAFVGSLLVGIALLRRRHDTGSRVAGWLLVLAVPLGIGIGLIVQLVLPDHEAGFYAAISLPTALAWAVLGPRLVSGPTPAPRPAGTPVPSP